MARGRRDAATRCVALLRGVNLGGRNRVPMAELRVLTAALGYGDVATLLHSGNLLFTAAGRSTAELGAELRAAIHAEFGVDTPVLVRTAAEFASEAAANPYAGVADRTHAHIVFFEVAPSAEAIAAARAVAADLAASVADPADVEEIAFDGRAGYLYTPGGLGRSPLAAALGRGGRPLTVGTARNLATVCKLLDLLAADPLAADALATEAVPAHGVDPDPATAGTRARRRDG